MVFLTYLAFQLLSSKFIGKLKAFAEYLTFINHCEDKYLHKMFVRQKWAGKAAYEKKPQPSNRFIPRRNF